MPRKTKIIFITVFIIVGALMVGIYIYSKKQGASTSTTVNNIYQKFNPFGSSDKVAPTPGDEEIKNPTEEVISETSRFQKITNFAVAGAAYFEDLRLSKDGSIYEKAPSIRYVEKSTGHVYQMYMDTKIEGKISNATIPSVYETIFDGKASSVIYRYLSEDNKTITSFLASLGGSSSFLSPNILEISLSPDRTKFFSIIKNKSGVVGLVKSFDESRTNQVFTSSFSEWLPQWAQEKSVYLTTKPSYLVDGNIYSLNITTGVMSKIFGGVPGLTTLANNGGSIILYSASLSNGPKLNIFDIKNHKSNELSSYGLPEKCVWSSDNINAYCAIPKTIVGTQYPDIWYQGLVTFDDIFVKINTQTGETITLADSQKEISVDATHLFLNNTEDKLFFINKKDGTLWSFNL